MNILEEIIREEIRTVGPITFARFMELALYHPDYGYYGSGRARLGKAGDYYTSPQATPVFGELFAEVYAALAPLTAGREFVEMGAGEGHFARDFLLSLRKRRPDLYGVCRYTIIERSQGMRLRQKETLGNLAEAVAWKEDIGALEGVSGVFFSNELVDAFPVHRVRKDWDALRELYVSVEKGKFVETAGPLSTPEIAKYFNRLGINLQPGTVTEVNVRAAEWMRALSRKLSSGYVITVDYGYSAYDYYSLLRERGTLMCYYRHTLSEDPFERVGEQDITAHVDFTTLATLGEENGLRPALFTDQGSFLVDAAALLEESMRRSGAGQEEMEALGRGLKTLIHPEWLGGAFRVLVQSKGAPDTPLFSKARNAVSALFEK